MNSDLEYARGDNGKQALVAAFYNREAALETVKRLGAEGFHETWIGVTSDDQIFQSADDSAGAKIGRFINGKADGASLAETLVRHGVAENEARRIDRSVEPNDVILTVAGHNHPELAAQIVEDAGGEILSGESFVPANIDWTESLDQLGSQLLGYEDPNLYARGQRLDAGDLTRLRSERLGRNTVPTVREELFVIIFDANEASRNPSGARSAGAAIGTQHREDVQP